MPDPLFCHRCRKPVGTYMIGDIEWFGGTYTIRPLGPAHLNSCPSALTVDNRDGAARSGRPSFSRHGINGDTPIYF